MEKDKPERYAEGGILSPDNLLFVSSCDYSLDSKIMANNTGCSEKIMPHIAEAVEEAIKESASRKIDWFCRPNTV